ncbi:MAG TPA: hypothetical protein P5557_08300, partial [Candidatus Sumerlaeia bacterium]|nr:hypothetical protein [Candidatus Sumerlaeia bacterium]
MPCEVFHGFFCLILWRLIALSAATRAINRARLWQSHPATTPRHPATPPPRHHAMPVAADVLWLCLCHACAYATPVPV